MEAIPLSLYVHLPWCVRKCPYCDFNSHALTDIPETEYVDALIADLEQALPGIWGRPVHSIFMGGGTPSLFSPEAIARLLQEIRIRLRLLPDTEITMEANPGTVEQGRFNGFREAGVNRLSLGVQSFNDTMLKSLGRIHNSLDAHHAIEIARKAGFDNLNLDLMFGLPEQTLQQAREDLAAATGHQPEHLSYYQLTIEPNTLFHHAPPLLPVDDLVWDMQQAGIEALDQQGFQRYEVSAYAQEGYTCRHNRNYWEFGDYLGIGAGAHSKISDLGEHTIQRIWKHRQPDQYLHKSANSYISGSETLLKENLPFEFMLNALRLIHGVDRKLFPQRTFLPLDTISPTLQALSEEGLVESSADHLVATPLGQQFLNDVISRFIP